MPKKCTAKTIQGFNFKTWGFLMCENFNCGRLCGRESYLLATVVVFAFEGRWWNGCYGVCLSLSSLPKLHLKHILCSIFLAKFSCNPRRWKGNRESPHNSKCHSCDYTSFHVLLVPYDLEFLLSLIGTHHPPQCETNRNPEDFLATHWKVSSWTHWKANLKTCW